MLMCRVPFLGHCDLDLWPSFKNNCVWSISPILLDVGIPNLVCRFFLGWWNGVYHFWSLWPWHWLLASFLGLSCLDISPILQLTFLKCVLCLTNFFGGIRHVTVTFLVSCYITAIFPQMCLILDQFLWGHLSRVCDISCFLLFSAASRLVSHGKWLFR